MPSSATRMRVSDKKICRKDGVAMRVTANPLVYRAFGLTIQSEIELPELMKASEELPQVDIFIETADLSSEWDQCGGEKQIYLAHEHGVMIRIPEVAIFSVLDGSRIRISPAQGAEESEVRLCLLGTCLGALLFQRGVLPLHGSAVEIDGKAYAFVGESGAGKSTLAAAFVRRGYSMITDDVVAVSMSEGIPYVAPAYPQQKLWLESLNGFGMSSDRYLPLMSRATKFAVPVPHLYAAEPLPLAGIFELVGPEDGAVCPRLQPIESLMRLHKLNEHTYRKQLLQPLGLIQWHFNRIAKLADSIGLYRLARPSTGFSAEEMTSEVLNTIHNRKEAVTWSAI